MQGRQLGEAQKAVPKPPSNKGTMNGDNCCKLVFKPRIDRPVPITSHPRSDNTSINLTAKKGLQQHIPKVSEHKVSVYGRLSKRHDFWDSFCKDKFICDIVKYGYKIPFYETPPPSSNKNNKNTIGHEAFISSEIANLMADGRIVKLTEAPTVVNPLSVSVDGGGKKRLILDLRCVNAYLFKFPVRYEDLDTFCGYVDKNSFMANFDLKSGYHHVQIFEEHQQYLGFSWNGSCYKFTVLPFGLSSACNIFTKLLRPLVKRWRGIGIKIVLYLDDGILTHLSEQTLSVQLGTVMNDLDCAGFVINYEKSCLNPVTRLTWLGMVIDTRAYSISLPEQKEAILLGKLSCILQKQTATARQISSVAGTITSYRSALGAIACLRTKGMCRQVAEAKKWDESMNISVETEEELIFWKQYINNYKPEPVKWGALPSTTVYTDASIHGGGGYIEGAPDKVVHFYWTSDERSQSSTHREARALLYFLREVLPEFSSGTNIAWYTDSRNASTVLNKGSMVKELNEIAIKIWEVTSLKGIKISPNWIAREYNTHADRISKFIDHDDWSIGDVTFEGLNREFGPFTCDLFASCRNFKCKKYYSKFYDRKSSGVNALNQVWTGENAWITPPVALILETIRKLQFDKCRGVLLIPHWQSASFWPELVEQSGLKAFVEAQVIFDQTWRIFSNDITPLFNNNRNFEMIALVINCTG